MGHSWTAAGALPTLVPHGLFIAAHGSSPQRPFAHANRFACAALAELPPNSAGNLVRCWAAPCDVTGALMLARRAARLFHLDRGVVSGNKRTDGYQMLRMPATGQPTHCLHLRSDKMLDSYAEQFGLRSQKLPRSLGWCSLSAAVIEAI